MEPILFDHKNNNNKYYAWLNMNRRVDCYSGTIKYIIVVHEF